MHGIVYNMKPTFGKGTGKEFEMRTRIAVLLVGAAVGAGAETVAERLAVPVLPGQELASYNLVYGQLKKKDMEADRAFAECKDAEGLKKLQEEIREKWIASFGGFPERTPLNPVFGATLERDGYSVTKVRYESQPGHHVTALLYRPDTRAGMPAPPCILMPCGHNLEGKAALPYQRAARLAAQMGFVVLSYDPIDQGERFQIEGYDSEDSCIAHNATGARAALLGWNTARFRIWDGIRSIDFLATLGYADAGNVGVMSYSGGGTLTSYLMALDPRVKAAAPACFITSLRDHCAHTGPHDAEQNFFGQLDYGLNHTALLMLRAPGLPVCVASVREDFFPIAGTEATLAAAMRAYANLGVTGIDLTKPAFDSPLGFIDAPGKHDWTEGMIQGSLAWMRAKLMGDKDALPYDIAKLRGLAFKPKDSEGLLTEEETFVTPTGSVLDLPGNRTTFDLMRDQLKRMDRTAMSDRYRHPGTYDGATTWRVIGQRAAIEKVLNFDRFPVEKARAEILSETTLDGGVKEIRQVLRVNHGEGMTNAVPMITFIPKKIKQSPVILLSQRNKYSLEREVTERLKDGRPVIILDVIGTGEIGQVRKGSYNLEGKDTNENVAMMLYLLGRSIIEFQTREILAAIDTLSRPVKGASVGLIACSENLIIPIKHACAYDSHGGYIYTLNPRGRKASERVLSWREAITSEPEKRFGDFNSPNFKGDGKPHYLFSNTIHGALRYYDWTELRPDAGKGDAGFSEAAINYLDINKGGEIK